MDRCAACKGVAHPSTGHAWSASVIVCGPCTRRFFAWVAQHTRPRKGSDFYGAAVRWKS